MSWSIAVAVLLVPSAAVALWRLPPLHPVTLWLLPWAAAVTLHALRLLPYRPLGAGTAALIVGATGAFAGGVLLAERRFPVWPRPPRTDAERALRLAAVAAGCLTALATAAFLVDVSRRFGLRAALMPSAQVREAIAAGTLAATIKYVYVALAGAVLLAYAAGRAQGRRRRLPWIAGALLCVAVTVFSTGRATVFAAFLIACAAFTLADPGLLTRRRFTAAVAAFAALAVVVLYVGGAIIGKTYENNVDIQSVESVFTEHPSLRPLALSYQYASAPVAALDVLVGASKPFGVTHGCGVLTAGCSILRRVGVPVQPVSIVRPFTARPLMWNTYTSLDMPLLDFGWVLLTPFALLLGLLVGGAWRAARDGLAMGAVVYAFLCAALIASAGSFNFLANHYVGAVLIALALWAIASRRPSRAPA
jgi:oligosaccharide repeat unit polymerase